ncbi:MAG: hypothetical protein Q9214_001350 [Letrouitia sp. 1 TL-2023]
MNMTLTTFDGYPRDDLDIAQIRSTRARIIWLRNDYKTLMSKIETGLHKHHAQNLSTRQLDPSSSRDTAEMGVNAAEYRSLDPPFAKVNNVVPASPADEAGLKAGDKIRRFGSVDWVNHEKLSKVADIVQRNEGVRTPS